MSQISTTLGFFLYGNASIRYFIGFDGFLGHRVHSNLGDIFFSIHSITMTEYAKRYNDAIYSNLEDDVEDFIDNRPQPTMLYTPPMVETPIKTHSRGLRGGGSKGGQKFVLTSGSLPYDYPSTLAVGSAKKPTSIAKEFYGEPELINQPYAYGEPAPKLVGGRIGRGSHKNVKEGIKTDGDVYSGGSILRAEMPLGYDTQYPMGGMRLGHRKVGGHRDEDLEGGKAPKWLRNIGHTIVHTGNKIANDERVRKLADQALDKAIEKGTEYGSQQLAGMGRMTQKKFHSLPRHLQEKYYHHKMSGGKAPKWLRDIGNFFHKTGKKIVNDERVRKLADQALDKAIEKGTEYGSQQLAGMGRKRGGAILEDSMPYSHAIIPSNLGKPSFKGRSNTARRMPAPLTAYSQSSAIYGAGRSGKSKSARGAMVSKLMKQKGMSLGEASKYIKEHGLM